MAMLVDFLVFAAAVVAAIYCHVLARRVARLADMRSGVGGAVAALSERVDVLTRTLEQAGALAGRENAERAALIRRAERAAGKLEIMLAALQDVENRTDMSGLTPQGASPDGDGLPRRPDREKPVADRGPAAPGGRGRSPGTGHEGGLRRPVAAGPVSSGRAGPDRGGKTGAAAPAGARRGPVLRATRDMSGPPRSQAAGRSAAAGGSGPGAKLVLRRRVPSHGEARSDGAPAAADARGARVEPAE